MSEEEKIIERIYGREFTLDTRKEDPLYLKELAKYVDKKMYEIANTSHIVDSSKVAVMTALNIANELFELKKRKNVGGEGKTKEYKELIEILDKAIKK